VAPDRPVTGRPLVFWPGLGANADRQVAEVGPLFAERGLDVLALAPPWDLEQDAYLPSRLADYVLSTAPFDRFVFMGHSWGGSIGVQLAADRPERLDGLVLLDAGYRDVDLQGATIDQVAAHFEAQGMAAPRAAAWALHGVATEKQTATHDRLDLPILLLLARDADPGALGEKPNVETHRLDSGHDILGDRPDETVRLVGDWVSNLPTER
jgi:pimeloyl-ACP methyl ester carboxylesterase